MTAGGEINAGRMFTDMIGKNMCGRRRILYA
jgi:hypothetical protein